MRLLAGFEKNEIDIFANGGDRKDEKDIQSMKFAKLGVKMIFDVGGNKIQSSSKLLNPFINYIEKGLGGESENLLETKKFLVKKLVINPGQKISVQLHKHRNENWTIVEGKGKIKIGKKSFLGTVGSSFSIPKNEIHTIENNQKTALVLLRFNWVTNFLRKISSDLRIFMEESSKVNKAVIPVAGMGTRMLPATKAIPKELLPIGLKPIIQHIVEETIEAGIEEIIFITRSGKEAIENHFDKNFELEKN